MIKKFDEFVSEGLIGNMWGRAGGTKQRKEDISKFDEPFKKIKESELVDCGSLSVLWTQFNFGSDSFDKPGWYMTSDEIEELNDYLENTEYRIATNADWSELFYRLNPKYERINGLWTLTCGDTFKLCNFGYISSWYAKNNQQEKIYKPTKKDSMVYASYADSNNGYVCMYYVDKYLIRTGFPKDEISDKVQVRLVKRK